MRREIASVPFLIALACQHGGDLATYVPSDTVALAGADLNSIRAWVPDTLREASELLVAFNGKDLVFLARGKFTQAPLGGTLIDSHLAVVGAPEAVRAAIAQHRTGAAGAADLLARAPQRPVWAVVRGGGALPLTGNAANLNRLLRLTDYASAGATVGKSCDIELTAHCRSADAARQFEETFRGAVTLAAAATERRADINALLESVDVRREDLTVRVTVSASTDVVGKLLR